MKAISRNEKYLSKLSGEEEVVPKPISREEKYMYRACGYVDKPIPKHAISREEKYWKKIIENGGGGGAVLTSKDITENGLYNAVDDEADGYSSVNVDVPNTYLLSDEGKVVSDGALVSQTSSTVSQNGVVDTTLIDSVNVNVPNINNILFAPPQKFKSNGSNLLDYKIFGNNTQHNYSAEGTLPLTFTSHTAGNAVDWSISGNDNRGKNLVDLSGIEPKTAGNVTLTPDAVTGTVTVTTSDGQAATAECVMQIYLPENIEGNYYLSGCPEGGDSARTYDIYPWDETLSARPKQWDGVTVAVSSTGNTPVEVKFIAGHVYRLGIRVRANQNINGLIFKPMLRLPDTSPDFEPYQIGVGQRTKNLFNATIEQGGLNSGSEYGSNTRIRTTFMPNMLDAGTYTINASGVNNVVINYFDDNKTYTGGVTTWRTLPFTFNISNRCYVRFAFKISDSQNVTPSDISNIMLVEGSTASASYIPYGYEIPLNVNSSTQDIYIGDTPLTAGQSVSKTSTGVDIAAIAGSNTITTELYNKLSMSIEGVDYVGVGESVNDGWQIPVKINSTTTNVPIDAPLVENEYVSYIDQKIYHYIDGTLTPVDPPSTLPHIATVNGVNELSIDVEVQPELVGIGLGNPIELVNT